MVQIELPTDEKVDTETNGGNPPAYNPAVSPQVKLGNTPVDSEAITQDGIDPEIASLNPADAGADLPSESSASGGFRNLPPGSNQPSLAGPPPSLQEEMQWQTEGTRKTRQIGMIVTIAVSTLSVTLLTFGWFVRMRRSQPDQNEDQVAVNMSSLETPAQRIVEPNSAVADATTSSQEDPFAETITESRLETEVESTNAESAIVDPAASVDPVGDSTADSEIPDSLIPTSPIDGASKTDSAFEDTDDAGSTMTELPAGLKQFMPLLLQEGPAEITSLATPPTINDIQIEAAEEESGTLGVAPPRPIRLRRDLGVSVAFNSKAYPLPSLVLLIGELTDVPIQLDWASFDLAGADVAKPVKVTGKIQPLSRWLDIIAEQVNAELRPSEFVMTLTPTDAAFEKAMASIGDLSDFGAESGSVANVLAAFMKAPADAAENNEPAGANAKDDDEAADEDENGDADKEADNGEVDAVNDQMAARQELQLKLFATDLLRRMRSIPPKIDNARASRWMQVDDGGFADWKRLDAVNPNSVRQISQPDTPITAAGMLRKYSTTNGIACLVNWYDTNRLGLRPTNVILPHASGKTASQTIENILGPFQLEIRAVDNGHWWVGNAATYDRLPILIASPRLGQGRDAYADQIDKVMAETGSRNYRSVHDPVSDRLLMMLPRFVARQLPKIAAATLPQ
jgi:hypothetical protein